MIPVIETDRLRLREWSESDFDPFAAFCADAELARFVGGACARDDAWRRLAAIVGHWTLRGYGYWALEEKASGKLVGWCGLWCPEGWPEPEVGWSLLKAAHGKGYATEAARRSREHAYRSLGWTTLISFIHPQNRASVRVAERLGARLESTVILRGSEVEVFRHPARAEM
jgi:RimJ/RimL family protein N-acetyltransferase